MTAEKSKHKELKKAVVHEFEEMLGIFLYLAFFFCAVTTYRVLLLDRFQVSYFDYGAALLNALIVAKVILLGEYAHIGRKHESKPLAISAVNKAFLYTLLVFAFHIVEETVKQLLHRQNIAGAFQGMRIDELASRSLVVFCTFIPFFGFRELRRVLGESTFRTLLFRTGELDSPGLSVRD
jgi:hypothetical protein